MMVVFTNSNPCRYTLVAVSTPVGVQAQITWHNKNHDNNTCTINHSNNQGICTEVAGSNPMDTQ